MRILEIFSTYKDEKLTDDLKDHQLTGNLKEFRECHVFGDLVIIY